MKNIWMQWIVEQLREFGPYFAVELLLPGGSLLALLLWLYRRLRQQPAKEATCDSTCDCAIDTSSARCS